MSGSNKWVSIIRVRPAVRIFERRDEGEFWSAATESNFLADAPSLEFRDKWDEAEGAGLAATSRNLSDGSELVNDYFWENCRTHLRSIRELR